MEQKLTDRAVADVIKQMQQVTLTSLGEALGQDTYDNCWEQQRLRRTLQRLVKQGIITKTVSDRENYYVYVEL